MAQVDADRNMLLGLLALQNSFVSREALVGAFSVWMLDKSRALAAILLEQKALTPDEHALLQALVAKHLQIHGYDPERSLAAVSAVGSVKDELQQLKDSQIDASLAKLPTSGPASKDGSNDAFRTRDVSVGTSSSAGSRFRVLRPHAKGGLGAVYVALDEELHRQVALKEIQNQHADDPQSRARFVTEAEITGGLEHPGIVPVYGLGQYADGRPYYAMRFVRGDSLKDAIARYHANDGTPRDAGQRALELRELLGRFLDVCDAVAYAHSRGVLHRDLKPGNIMVGKYGETLVVDWGLAKAVGRGGNAEGGARTDEPTLYPASASGSAETLPGSALGTPAFMSPEQAAGQLDKLGAASDVYSLGATLYTILTGRPPFDDPDVGRVLQRVQKGEFPRPRLLDRTIAPALEAICLKATALRPEDRYASPRELAQDVKNWLADQRVKAMRENLLHRVRRWARRHRAVTQAAIGSLVIVAIMATVSAIAIDQKRQVALRERARAERNFRQARGAVDDYLTQLSENQLLDVPGLEPLRKQLLEAALGYYKQFIQQAHEERADLQADLAAAYFRVANITAEIGSEQEALAAHRKALEIRQRLARQFPRNLVYQANVAHSYNNIGSLYARMAQTAEAEHAHRQALEIRARLVRESPRSPQSQADLAQSHFNLGQLYGDGGQLGRAEEEYRKALAAIEPVARENPGVDDFQGRLASIQINLGRIYDRTGRRAEAQNAYSKALAAYERLVARHPTATTYQRELASIANNQGNLLSSVGRVADAETAHKKALAVRARLVAEHPDVAQFQFDLAGSHNNLGKLYRVTGRPGEAESAHKHALALRERLAQAHPDVASYQWNVAQSHFNLGTLHHSLGRAREAEDSFQRALAILDGLSRDHPNEPDYEQLKATVQINLGNVFHALGRHAEAESAYRSALALYERESARQPNVPEVAREVASAENNLGLVYRDRGQYAEAEGPLQKARQVRERLVREHPEVAQYRKDLADSDNNLGDLYVNMRKLPEAQAAFERSLDVRRRLAQENPDASENHAYLGQSYYNLGNLYRLSNRPAGAEAAYQQALVHREKLAHDHPEVLDFERDLSITHNNLGVLYLGTGQAARAEQSFRKARTLGERMMGQHPDRLELVIDLALAQGNLGRAAEQAGHSEEARKHYGEAIETLEALLRQAPGFTAGKKRLGIELNARAGVFERQAQLDAALADRDRALAVTEGADRTDAQILRAITLARRGDHISAISAAHAAIDEAKAPPTVLYNLACVYARASGAASKDASLSEPARKETADRYAEHAFSLLTRAYDGGFLKDPPALENMKNDADLEPLRARDQFRALLRQWDPKAQGAGR